MASGTSGTITLVFTDIAGSTRLLHALGDAYATLLADHHRLVSEAAAAHDGTPIDAAGDGLFLSFPTVRGALLACIEAQRSVAAHPWPQDADVQVRMGLHTGEPQRSGASFVGIDVHRAARICAAGHGGQILISQAAQSLIGPSLPDGVGLVDLGEHRLKDLPAAERLYQVVAPGLRSDFPPVRSLDTLPNNLPRQLSTFIGRVEEVKDAEQRLAGAAILTLTGPGGVGKTRLAVEIGTHLLEAFPDGVWFVELAGVSEGDLVAEAIASALRVKQRPGTDVRDTLRDALADRRVLLILDNCEHVLDPVVATAHDLLHHCPDLRLLATSREALGLIGESLMPVPSMSLPATWDGDAAAVVDQMSQYDAVRLFLDRAQSVLPGFVLTQANAGPIAQICRRLDGIPLAIELAAARVRSLPVQQIAARLDDRFRLLTGGSRTALPRHRTLRAAMDWSFDLLSPAEQVLLPRLSVFAKSFSLDAAEAVCSGGAVESAEMLDLLSRLVDRSLLLPDEATAEARFRMLETVRDYAQERLSEAEEAPSIYRRHLDWFVALVEQARTAFFAGPVQPVWINRLDADHDNLRAALRWAHEDADGAEAELSLASGLWRFWEIRGDLAEGSAWLERALARVGGGASARRANALTGAGVLAAQRGDLAKAASFHEATLMLRRELGEPRGIAVACNNLASVWVELGDFDKARSLYDEGIEQSRSAGDQQGVGLSLLNLADAAVRYDLPEADEILADAITQLEGVGDQWGLAQATSKLAKLARRRGELAMARARFDEALAIHRRLGDKRAEAQTLAQLGDVDADGGDFTAAQDLYRRALALRAELGDRSAMPSVFERLAGVSEDRPERAAVLVGVAGGLRDAIDAPLAPAGLARLDQFLAGLRNAVGRERVDTAYARGRAMRIDEAIRYAIGDGV